MFRLFKRRMAEVKQEADRKTTTVEESLGEGKGRKIREKDIEDILWDLELALLEADVAQEVASAVVSEVKKRLLSSRLKKGVSLGDAVETAMKDAILKVLEANYVDFDDVIKSHIEERETDQMEQREMGDRGWRPFVIMFVGVNGSGKTTAIAKIAYRLRKMGVSCVIAAGDTFRAGAVEQLQKHADRLGVKLIKHRPGADPAAVAYDAVEHASARRRQVVLVDTAGRMQTNVNLMDEMKKIKRVVQPDMIIFVGDALAGNDMVEQARKFNEAVGVDTVILTKIDADAKGGGALSIAYAVGKPVAFVSTGQKYHEFEKFNPRWMVDRLFA